jgi:nitrite reductase/ring-hydroxylating ferredoxin subunit
VEYFKAATRADIAHGGCITVKVAGVWVAIAELEGAYYAVANKCPHSGAPLGMGQMDHEWIVCPYHGWAFSVKSGTWDNDRTRTIPTYPLRLEGDEIWIGFTPEQIEDPNEPPKVYPSIWEPGTKPSSGHSDSCC